jgi:mannose-6-phosphate isomerase-like protein (cupin superfamily)
MTAVHHLIDRELITALGDQERDVQIDVPGVRYLEFDRQPGLSTGIYELRAGVEDPQGPHGEDEIYVVIHGRAVVELAGRRTSIQPGSIICVPRATQHRFVEVQEDLQLVVIFGPPEGSLRKT